MIHIEKIPCKICTTPTRMLGTKLCDWCYHGVRDGEAMFNKFGADLEIKLCRGSSEFRWSVDMTVDGVTYGHSASTFEDALAGAAKRLREAT